jgi:hypothetical protein
MPWAQVCTHRGAKIARVTDAQRDGGRANDGSGALARRGREREQQSASRPHASPPAVGADEARPGRPRDPAQPAATALGSALTDGAMGEPLPRRLAQPSATPRTRAQRCRYSFTAVSLCPHLVDAGKPRRHARRRPTALRAGDVNAVTMSASAGTHEQLLRLALQAVARRCGDDAQLAAATQLVRAHAPRGSDAHVAAEAAAGASLLSWRRRRIDSSPARASCWPFRSARQRAAATGDAPSARRRRMLPQRAVRDAESRPVLLP